MRLKETLLFMALMFCVIVTFQVIFTAIYCAVADVSDNTINAAHTLLIAFSSTLPTLIFLGGSKFHRVWLIARSVLHFILTAAIVFGLLVHFQLINASNAVFVATLFLGIYIIGYVIQEMKAKKTADALNKRISAFHDSENATCHIKR